MVLARRAWPRVLIGCRADGFYEQESEKCSNRIASKRPIERAGGLSHYRDFLWFDFAGTGLGSCVSRYFMAHGIQPEDRDGNKHTRPRLGYLWRDSSAGWHLSLEVDFEIVQALTPFSKSTFTTPGFWA